MCTGHSTAGREPRMDTERDIIIETDEDHIVRGLD